MPASTHTGGRPALFTLLSLFIVIFSPLSLSHGGVRHDFRLAGGKWFDGRSFVERTVYSVGGVFRDTWDGPVEATLDLAGTFVVGPYADVHTHDLGGGPDPEGRIRERLRQGVFYLKNTNSVPRWAASIKPLVNRPESVDVAWANGGLTASGGHPIQIYENVVAHPPVPDWTKADLPDQAYVVVDDKAILDAKWPAILADKPDFLKIYLEHSEEFAKRKEDRAFFGKKGLDPALVPSIVAKAHAAGLRVTAHARTAADFRAALSGGVDELAHLPLARLTAEDAHRCAERNITVVTTTLGHWDREGMPTRGRRDPPREPREPEGGGRPGRLRRGRAPSAPRRGRERPEAGRLHRPRAAPHAHAGRSPRRLPEAEDRMPRGRLRGELPRARGESARRLRRAEEGPDEDEGGVRPARPRRRLSGAAASRLTSGSSPSSAASTSIPARRAGRCACPRCEP